MQVTHIIFGKLRAANECGHPAAAASEIEYAPQNEQQQQQQQH